MVSECGLLRNGFIKIIKEYLKNERLSEKNIAKTYNELQKFSQKDRKLAVAYLKGKIADYDIRHDLKCMNAKLVTGNLKHYPVHELRTSLDELYGEK